jgi:hypothetical protein
MFLGFCFYNAAPEIYYTSKVKKKVQYPRHQKFMLVHGHKLFRNLFSNLFYRSSQEIPQKSEHLR